MLDTQAKIVGILESQIGTDVSQITSVTRLREDLDADSLEVVELILSVEEMFAIEIPDDDAEKLVTVGDLVSYIERKQVSGRA